MRPAISDSLISGQPLYLLNSNSNCGPPRCGHPLLAAFATQATGSVRLQVTGRPPTCNGPFFSAVQEIVPQGTAAARSPCSTCLR